MFCDEMGEPALLESFQPDFGRLRESLEKIALLGIDYLYKYTFGPGTATKDLEIEVKTKGTKGTKLARLHVVVLEA